ncbi:MAG TPA: (d)CMP kinase [Sphingomonadales bacterium]|nr:(d)CMP kinase [Sphingomonadales bacterium]
MIIAIDGPSASGKGTLARQLARRLDFAHLDTGSLYRGVALLVLDAGGRPQDAAAAIKAAKGFSLEILNDRRIRSEATGEAASHVAAIPGVRAELLAFQRRFAAAPPGGKKGAVIDGRDIGTVVCPEADLKFFVTASPEVRAERRTKELLARGEAANPAQVLATIRERDRRDQRREASPLRAAEDAHLLDTTKLDIDGAFQKALDVLASKGFLKTK